MIKLSNGISLAERLQRLHAAAPPPKPQPQKVSHSISLEQIQNLTSLLEARFESFHAGPKFWLKAQKDWQGIPFEAAANGVLAVMSLSKNTFVSLPMLTRYILDARDGKI